MNRSSVESLTPQMASYAGKFSDAGEINWKPYLMYFHPQQHRSSVVNTDGAGFRWSDVDRKPYSVTAPPDSQAVSLLVGSSTVFGIGATSDATTLSSRLSHHDPDGVPWLNFGGRSFNSTQELILFLLHRRDVESSARIDRIVVFSGFNDLGLARLPERQRYAGGGFFMSARFGDALAQTQRTRSALFKRSHTPKATESTSDTTLNLDDQISFAAELTVSNLSVWKALADVAGASLTFVLQPLSNWVRTDMSVEEQQLFDELERKGRFSESYGDILSADAHQRYASALRQGADALDVPFFDFSSRLASALKPEDWMFVDRIHFTDFGYDLSARLILEILSEQRKHSA